MPTRDCVLDAPGRAQRAMGAATPATRSPCPAGRRATPPGPPSTRASGAGAARCAAPRPGSPGPRSGPPRRGACRSRREGSPPSGRAPSTSMSSGRIATCTSAPGASAVADTERPASVRPASAPFIATLTPSGPSALTRPRRITVDPTKSRTKADAGRSYRLRGGPTCSTRPRCITAMRSERLSASIWSWVTKSTVIPSRRWSSRSSSRICSRSLASRLLKGSSSSRRSGS